MIKVLNIISDSNIGGAGRCIINFAKYYDKERFHLTVAMPKGSLLKEALEACGTDVVEVEGIADRSLDWKAIGTLKQVIRQVNPDVVHTHGAMAGRIAGKLCGKPVVFTRHSVFPVKSMLAKQPGKAINGFINEHTADAMIAVAEAAKENLVESGIHGDRVKVILNGVEAMQPASAEEQQKKKETLGIQPGTMVFTILARMEAVKGHRYILEAAKILEEKGYDFQVLIAGKGSEEDAIRQAAEQLQTQAHVQFLGFVKDVRGLLSITDVQLNASYGTEATSLSLLEGMSMGVPAIVSDFGGNPGVITHEKNGLIFPKQNSEALAACMERLLTDEALMQSLQKGSFEVFQEKFTVQTYAAQIESVYLSVLKKGGNNL